MICYTLKILLNFCFLIFLLIFLFTMFPMKAKSWIFFAFHFHFTSMMTSFISFVFLCPHVVIQIAHAKKACLLLRLCLWLAVMTVSISHSAPPRPLNRRSCKFPSPGDGVVWNWTPFFAPLWLTIGGFRECFSKSKPTIFELKSAPAGGHRKCLWSRSDELSPARWVRRFLEQKPEIKIRAPTRCPRRWCI